MGCQQVVADVVFQHGDANFARGLVGGCDGSRTYGLVHIGGLINGVVHHFMDIDSVGCEVGGQVLWRFVGGTQAIAEEEAHEAGGGNGDLPSPAVA